MTITTLLLPKKKKRENMFHIIKLFVGIQWIFISIFICISFVLNFNQSINEWWNIWVTKYKKLYMLPLTWVHLYYVLVEEWQLNWPKRSHGYGINGNKINKNCNEKLQFNKYHVNMPIANDRQWWYILVYSLLTSYCDRIAWNATEYTIQLQIDSN